MQEDKSEFDSSMIDDPGTPEYIPDVEEKNVNLSSAVMVEGKKNYTILLARKCKGSILFLNFASCNISFYCDVRCNKSKIDA